MGQGWVPTERKNKVNEEDDPLIEQMNIIRSYIKQAQYVSLPPFYFYVLNYYLLSLM